MQKLNCDFYVFSGHKMFGPTGIGGSLRPQNIIRRHAALARGGEMIHRVSFQKTTFNELPFKFEAGTPHIAVRRFRCKYPFPESY